MKKIILLTILGFALLVSCTDRDDEVDAINIRIKNDSSINFVEVRIGDSEEIYENINPDSYSDYLIYLEGFTSNTVSILAGDETFQFTPEGMEEEMSLPIGLYTYKFSLDDEGTVLLEFVID